MKQTLDFVKGAVSTKDLVPVLSNFHFYDGRVQGNNGRIVIDAPCDVGGKAITVKAVPFLKAVEACDGEPNLKINDKGKLIISKKKFRSTLALSEQDTFPRIERPEGLNGTWELLEDCGFLAVVKKLRPFVGEDASRPWSCGVLFKDDYAYATNNVLIARVPFDLGDLAYFNLPVFAIDELIRIGQDPDDICLTQTSVTFGYKNKGWLQSKLFDLEWPDVERFFKDEATDPIPDNLKQAVEQVLPFCPDPKFPVLKFSDQGVSTADGDMSASVDCGVLPEACFRAEPLLTMLNNATHCNFKNYPKPCAFKGNGIEGVMVGIKL